MPAIYGQMTKEETTITEELFTMKRWRGYAIRFVIDKMTDTAFDMTAFCGITGWSFRYVMMVDNNTTDLRNGYLDFLACAYFNFLTFTEDYEDDVLLLIQGLTIHVR